jgi:antitoxin component YwqK of YwqJK toxin-antitoxin module
MLEKINSSFILKKIFYNLDIKKKLNLIMHNKLIQKKLGLNLIDYKRISGRYIIQENNKIKEYNSYNHQILFEGYFSNGKRNGGGKEYNEDGDLIFEGEYLDGKRWKGHEKVYDEDNGKLIFEYEYSN